MIAFLFLSEIRRFLGISFSLRKKSIKCKSCKSYCEVELMIISTTDVLQGIVVEEYLGVVTAEVVYGTNALRDFFAGIRDLIGGRTASYERVFQQGHQEALQELEQRARSMGANAVIGVEVDTGTINVDQKGALLLVTATGTAVRLG